MNTTTITIVSDDHLPKLDPTFMYLGEEVMLHLEQTLAEALADADDGALSPDWYQEALRLFGYVSMHNQRRSELKAKIDADGTVNTMTDAEWREWVDAGGYVPFDSLYQDKLPPLEEAAADQADDFNQAAAADQADDFDQDDDFDDAAGFALALE